MEDPNSDFSATTSILKMGGDGFRILLEEDAIELKNKNRSFLIEIDPRSQKLTIFKVHLKTEHLKSRKAAILVNVRMISTFLTETDAFGKF